MDDEDLKKRAAEIALLAWGHPGPFFEDERSFFGRPYASPDRKSDRMQTDCGGMVVTKSAMTYGEADAIADAVDLADLYRFLTGPESPKWATCVPTWSEDRTPIRDPYFSDWNCDDRVFHGVLWVAVYRYLVQRGLIPGKPTSSSYSNSMEYLYDRICDRLVAAGSVSRTADRRWFDLRCAVVQEST